MRRLTPCALLLWFALAPMGWAQKWAIQYFYDEDKTELELTDLAFPSATRGVAIGTIYETNGSGRPKFTALVTSDGGEHWSLVPVKEFPRSIFFLNDSVGWMVTNNGIWFTEESGRSWKKIGEQLKPGKKILPVPQGGLILRVWFLDAQHGFGVGLQKTLVETKDGGHTWTPVEEAAKPTGNPSFTAYTRIAFASAKEGVIMGGSTPPRREDGNRRALPAWMEPERATKQRQVPTLTLMLQTNDGGGKWTSSTSPLFGVVNSVCFTPNEGLIVFGFNESFEWPSEVYRLTNGLSTRVFREKGSRIVDCAIYPGPLVFLAGVEPPGRLNTVPIPGRVKVFVSPNFTDWKPMEVDYKAAARSLVLAGPDAEHMWAATDTGMILHLTPKP